MRLGPRQMPVRLKHWDGDTFAVARPGYGAPAYTDGFVSFQFGAGEQATALSFLRSFDDAGDGRFTRSTPP
ncbi:MAG TPA: hypothetical protein VMT79_09920 [Candidatus Binatia bacterium]|nr:hypothetical protein [Candidatus Binatia bacterium]